jgi:hypothetical protein
LRFPAAELVVVVLELPPQPASATMRPAAAAAINGRSDAVLIESFTLGKAR